MGMLDIGAFSRQYEVRRIRDADVPLVCALCSRNTLYYQYCPPFVTPESIRRDMAALPPGKTAADKYYVGYFSGQRLVAVLDLILGFPRADTALIGFFMTEPALQNRGLGSGLIAELCACLASIGISRVRLGWAKGNPQAEHFWHKNGFAETGDTYPAAGYTVIAAQRETERREDLPAAPPPARPAGG